MRTAHLQRRSLMQKLVAQGVRITNQRRVLVETIQEAKGRLDAATLLAMARNRDATIDRATVYRTMAGTRTRSLVPLLLHACAAMPARAQTSTKTPDISSEELDTILLRLEAHEMPSSKSPGLLQYEREAALLVEQYRADKIDFKQFSASMMAALRRGADAMTEMELREAERSLMVMLNDAMGIPAKLGHPLPGDNPDRPN